MIMLEEQEIPELAAVLFAGVLEMEGSFHTAVALEDLTAVTNYARWEIKFCFSDSDVRIRKKNQVHSTN